MSEHGVRQLFEAEAADDHIGVSTVDVDAVIRREREAMTRRRRASLVAVLAATLGVAVAVPTALGGLSGGTGQAPPVAGPGDSPTPALDPRGNDPGKCSEGAVPVSLDIPEFKAVKVRVVNGTDRPVAAAHASRDLQARGLTVLDTVPSDRKFDEVAIIRYGPKTVGAGWVTRGFFLDEATLEYSAGRTDDVVEVVLGRRFVQIASPTEVNQALAVLPRPALPEGTCHDPSQAKPADANEEAARVLVRYFQAKIDVPFPTDGVGAAGHGTYRGSKVEVSVTVLHSETPWSATDRVPCQPQSSQYRNVTCRDVARPDGTVVALRGAETGGKYFTEAIHQRKDGTDVLLMVSYDRAKPNRYPDDVLVSAASSPQLHLP